MGQIYSTQSPYPPIGAAALCEGCPVTVVDQAQNWTWTPQGDQGWTLALEDSSGNWTAVPNDFNSSVVVSQERSQIWNIGWANNGSSPLYFNVSLPGNDLLYWTITGTGNGTLVQLLGDGSDKPFWYQEFSTPSPPTQ